MSAHSIESAPIKRPRPRGRGFDTRRRGLTLTSVLPTPASNTFSKLVAERVGQRSGQARLDLERDPAACAASGVAA